MNVSADFAQRLLRRSKAPVPKGMAALDWHVRPGHDLDGAVSIGGQCIMWRTRSGGLFTAYGKPRPAVPAPLLPALVGAPEVDRIYNMDVMAYLRSIPGNTVHCVFTSPPYWAIRDYGVDGQIGQEESLWDFIDRMVEVFREVRRVLRPDGVLWLNMGDGYANDGKWGGSTSGKHVQALHGDSGPGRAKRNTGLKPKDLIGMPWRVALALQDDGWWLRGDHIWHKTNSMPESVKDRPVRAHEYVFLLTKSEHYWYDRDAVAKPAQEATLQRYERAVSDQQKMIEGAPGQKPHSFHQARENKKHQAGVSRYDGLDEPAAFSATSNLRSVWSLATGGYKGAHFAVFPPALVEIGVKAGCPPKVCSACGMPYVRETEQEFAPQADVSPERAWKDAPGQKPPAIENHWGETQRGTTVRHTVGWSPQCECDAPIDKGIVLDPFMGSGTTAFVARNLFRHYMGCDLNIEYVEMARERVRDPWERPKQAETPLDDLPLFQGVGNG